MYTFKGIRYHKFTRMFNNVNFRLKTDSLKSISFEKGRRKPLNLQKYKHHNVTPLQRKYYVILRK